MHNYNKNIYSFIIRGNMRYLILILAVVTVMLSSGVSNAQGRDTLDKKNFREKLMNVKKDKLMEKMNIDETTADKIFDVVGETIDVIRGYNKQKRTTYQYIEQNPDASDLDSKINELLDLDIQIANAKKEQYNKLKEFLTPKQIAKAYIFNRKFDQEIRKKIKDFKGDKEKGERKRKKNR
jgi:Spy/CpxP family protein refolding chaperone